MKPPSRPADNVSPASAAAPTPARPAPASSPEAVYRERLDHFTQERDAARLRLQGSMGRLTLLLVATAGCVLYGVFGNAPLLLWLVLPLAAAIVAVMVRQGDITREQSRFETLRQVNEEGLYRLARDWSHLPLRRSEGEQGGNGAGGGEADAVDAVDAAHAYAGDIDLLGRASLMHLLDTANTPAGQATLLSWLLEPAEPDVIRARQAAVAELAPLVEVREQVAVLGKQISLLQPTYEPFLRWAESDNWLTPQPWLVWLTRLFPLLLLVLLIAEIAGLTAYPIWIAFAGINWLVTAGVGRQVEERLDQIASRQSAFAPYADLFTMLSAQRFTSPDLRRIQAALAADGAPAGEQMHRLARIMRYGDLRLSLLYPFLQFGLLWSFHVLWFLERWQRVSGQHARAWLATLSEMEALTALATLAHDNPDWAFPEIVEAPAAEGDPLGSVFAARDVGHPLLPPARCVRNDVSIGPAGTFVLVTGSNMSGKSTLLRAVGVNVVLAQTGGPVCAASLRMRPVALATSMRVRDSLELGMSYYMAELARLKLVVDEAEAVQAVQAVQASGGRTVLFLLDEILHGTNTSERRIAAATVIEHLLALGATGMVSTHDLSLAQIPDLAGVSQQVHFTESFTRGPDGLTMHFDFKLRPGIATSTNALKLMEMAGLPLPKHAD